MPRHSSWDPAVLLEAEEVGVGRAGAWSVLEDQWAPPGVPESTGPGLSALLHLHLVALEEIAPSLKTPPSCGLLFLLLIFFSVNHQTESINLTSRRKEGNGVLDGD